MLFVIVHDPHCHGVSILRSKGRPSTDNSIIEGVLQGRVALYRGQQTRSTTFFCITFLNTFRAPGYPENKVRFRVRLVCLQLDTDEFFVHTHVWELACLLFRSFLLTIGAFLLTAEALLLAMGKCVCVIST